MASRSSSIECSTRDLTLPSRGRPQASSACLRPPLMSNVRPHGNARPAQDPLLGNASRVANHCCRMPCHRRRVCCAPTNPRSGLPAWGAKALLAGAVGNAGRVCALGGRATHGRCGARCALWPRLGALGLGAAAGVSRPAIPRCALVSWSAEPIQLVAVVRFVVRGVGVSGGGILVWHELCASTSPMRPNPSIEGTSTSGLRPLAAAPHVKR